MSGKRLLSPQPKRKIGFTNQLAVKLVRLLSGGLLGGFILAVLSIKYNYVGSLLCYTCVFTPIGTAISIVLAKVVDKNKAENTSANGDGIVYATAKAHNFVQQTQTANQPRQRFEDSPAV